MPHDARKIQRVQTWLHVACARMYVGYDVVVSADFCDEGNHATIQRDGLGFMVHLAEGFFDLDARSKRAVLVHELAHTYFDQMDSVQEAMLANKLSPVDLDTMRKLRIDAEHTAIDRVTRAVCPSVALPKF